MNYADLLVNGDVLLPALLRDIAEARRSIHLSIFLFFRDPIGEEIAAALARKAAEGVQVRVLLNMAKTEMGDPFSTGEKRMIRHDPNVHYDPTDVEPALRVHAQERRPGGRHEHRLRPRGEGRRCRGCDRSARRSATPSPSTTCTSITARSSSSTAGSRTAAARTSARSTCSTIPSIRAKDSRVEAEERKKRGLPEPWWKWHDSLTRFEGPIAREIDAHFRDRWILDGGADYQPPETARRRAAGEGRIAKAEVLLNEPNDQPNHVRERYVELIRGARESIFIENPYLYHPAIADALIAAKTARPSLRVDLVLPARDLERQLVRARRAAAPVLAVPRRGDRGLRVPEPLQPPEDRRLRRPLLHPRLHNLNYRSLEDDKDFELVVCVEDEGLAQRGPLRGPRRRPPLLQAVHPARPARSARPVPRADPRSPDGVPALPPSPAVVL